MNSAAVANFERLLAAGRENILPRFGRGDETLKIAAIIELVALNLRGMKEAIKFLLPIFIGFVVFHALAT